MAGSGARGGHACSSIVDVAWGGGGVKRQGVNQFRGLFPVSSITNKKDENSQGVKILKLCSRVLRIFPRNGCLLLLCNGVCLLHVHKVLHP